MNELNVKMTAIADEIRELSGAENKLGLDTMATNIQEANEEIALQTELLAQAITELEGKVSPELYDEGYAAGVQSAQADIIGLVDKKFTVFKNDSVTAVGNYVFAEATSLTEVDLPNVTTIGNYVFQSSTQLTTVKLPSVKTIGTRSFVNTSSFRHLDLPACTSLGNYCFHGSCKINTLILRSQSVCVAGTDIFGSSPIASNNGYIYVPDNLVEQYKVATNWSNYADQIKPLSDLEV